MQTSNAEWLLWLLNVRASMTVEADTLLAEAEELEIERAHVRLAVDELVRVRLLEWMPGSKGWEPGAMLRRPK